MWRCVDEVVTCPSNDASNSGVNWQSIWEIIVGEFMKKQIIIRGCNCYYHNTYLLEGRKEFHVFNLTLKQKKRPSH